MWAYRKTIRVRDVGDAKGDIAQAEKMAGFLTGVVTKSLVEGAPYVIHFYFEDVGQGARWAQDLKRVSLSPESLEDWGLRDEEKENGLVRGRATSLTLRR